MGLRLHGRLSVVRPATVEDAELLVAWHADPEVARYWDGMTFTHEEMVSRLSRRDVDSFIVEAAEEPVGYMQAWWEEGSPVQGGIDMFLVPKARGNGLGPDAARALTSHLREDRGWTRVTVDPYAWNGSAIRAWQRAGFVETERRPADIEHAAPWVLMVWEG